MKEEKWSIPKTDLDLDSYKDEGINLSETSLKVLYNRGIDTPEKVKKFLNQDVRSFEHPSLLKDAEKAVDIIIDCIKNNERMVLYGDYDADGVTASALGCLLIGEAGGDIIPYSNNRFENGYGICKDAIDTILSLMPEVKLIITADNGISAHEAIGYAKSKGLKVIVTDHHDVPDVLPNADAIVNPKRKDETYPFKSFCGCGVLYKLMLLLYEKMGLDQEKVYNTLDIVALGTVGDVVNIIGENHSIVKEGLRLMNNDNRRVAFTAMKNAFGIKEIDSFACGFQLCPMINSLTRILGHPMTAIELLMTDDEETANKIAVQLKQINDERKELTINQMEQAEAALAKKGIKEVIVLYGEYHEGIIGLIAGRLKEKYNRPTIILTKSNNDEYTGSARSIDKFNIKANFDTLAHLFVKYGGHEKAAGFTIKESNIEKLEEGIIKLIQSQLSEKDYIQVYYVDDVLNGDKMSKELLNELESLKPFGEGFSKPLFEYIFSVAKFYTIGNERQHLKLVSTESIPVLAWNQAKRYSDLGFPTKIKALGTPNLNVFNGDETIQFMVNDEKWKVC